VSEFVHVHDIFVMFNRVQRVAMVMMNAMLRPSLVKIDVNKTISRECFDTTGVQVQVSGERSPNDQRTITWAHDLPKHTIGT
jgi:hypothetical protein